jgi:hypothetical protein
LHRGLHGLAAVAGKRGQSFVGLDDAGELICGANSVELVRPREIALEGQRCADGGRTGSFTNAPECLQNVAVQSGLREVARGVGFLSGLLDSQGSAAPTERFDILDDPSGGNPAGLQFRRQQAILNLPEPA